MLAGDRRMAGRSVPACGLYLTSVSYPGWIFSQNEEYDPATNSV
jgi:hypothetical protein